VREEETGNRDLEAQCVKRRSAIGIGGPGLEDEPQNRDLDARCVKRISVIGIWWRDA
jgi:hypothetical protein